MLATEGGEICWFREIYNYKSIFQQEKGEVFAGVGSHSGFSLTREIKGTISKSVILAWRILI